MATKQNKESFEIKEITAETVVYQRVLDKKGKTIKKIKQIKKVEASLPTATIHTISLDEFEKLKNIEAKLIKELKPKVEVSINSKIKDVFISFLEV